ncbi:TetR family transcriptional regulator [Marinibacterium profundimaris]|uniref:TetR family transcriptional regulator n=2 Tax=Marinibacterium profundimaris TaxID=1679460 RepID=A0A225NG09_9RHOB|nr:TetR family transcriptional regulator [Marinibacterium profundimaris]
MSSDNPDTRTRILTATWTLLEAAAPGKPVRMADVAKAAGISRQAVYLHFPTRAELLSAVTRHVDEVKDIDSRLAASRAAPTGRARLDAFVQAWGDYIPEIQGMARALMAMRDTDAEARAAWDDRMAAVREGCAAAARALEQDGDLRADLDVTTATDLLTALLSVETWRQLREGCGWEQDAYVRCMQRLAAQALMG